MLFNQKNRTHHIIRLVSFLMLLLILMLCAGLSSINLDYLMDGTQSGKSIVFLWGIGIVSVLALIRFVLKPYAIINNLSIIDLLLFTFLLSIVLRNNWSELRNSLQFFELIGLAFMYFIIRRLADQDYRWILIALMLGGLFQAVYGNLQLWGYFPSNHGIFRMTGSFFNPGPYSGYLAAIFPIALGLYLFNVQCVSSNTNTIASKLNVYLNCIKSYFDKISRAYHLFNIKDNSKLSSEELKNRKTITNTFLKSLALISIITIFLVLPASRSRAAWLAVLVSSLYLFSVKYQLFKQVKAYFNTRIKKLSLLLSVVVILIIGGTALYHFKKGSADGRLLIWKVSTEMIKDKPVLGHGFHGFKNHYLDYQADFFKRYPESKDAMVADDSSYAFNELIQLTVENGMVGLLLVLLIVAIIFSNKLPISLLIKHSNNFSNSKASNFQTFEQSNIQSYPDSDSGLLADNIRITISRALILSVLVFGLFSYPLQILPIKICMVVALAIVACRLSKNEKASLHRPLLTNQSLRFAVKSIVSVGCMGLFWLAANQLQHTKTAYADWKDAFDSYNMGIYDDCLTDYQKAYPALKTNGDFLTNYGKALSVAEKYAEAVDVLQQAARYYPNTVVYTALGDSYKKLGQTANAEYAYTHAWNMNPSRFYVKYLMAKLYNETGQKEKAIDVAKELLAKDVKIESTAIKEIQEEMKMIIGK